MTEATPLTREFLLGSWRMISWTYTVVETGEKRDALGPNPRGFIVYTPERVMVLVLKNDRRRPSGLLPTDDEKLALYDSMFAYSGVYTVKPDRVRQCKYRNKQTWCRRAQSFRRRPEAIPKVSCDRFSTRGP